MGHFYCLLLSGMSLLKVGRQLGEGYIVPEKPQLPVYVCLGSGDIPLAISQLFGEGGRRDAGHLHHMEHANTAVN